MSTPKRKWNVLGVAAALNAEYPRVDYHGEILKVVAFVLSAVGVELEESDKVYEYRPPVKEEPFWVNAEVISSRINGEQAFKDGKRRDENPYVDHANEDVCLAWYWGWDYQSKATPE